VADRHLELVRVTPFGAGGLMKLCRACSFTCRILTHAVPGWQISHADRGMKVEDLPTEGLLARRDAVQRFERVGREVQIAGGDVFGQVRGI
jgi:hypothetical protein